LSYKNLTERDAFLVSGGGPATYTTHPKINIRRCIPEILPYVAENYNWFIQPLPHNG
jgi:hypothetical protein